MEYIGVAVYGGVAVAALRLHRRLRTTESRWLFLTFLTLALVVVEGALVPSTQEQSGVGYEILADLVIVVLLFFPYCLFRFAEAFGGSAGWRKLVANVLLLCIIVATFALPPLGGESEVRSPAVQAFVVAVLAYWTILSLWMAGRLWSGGRGQPIVARRRMRLLAAGTVLMNGVILLAGADLGPNAAIEIFSQLAGWASAALFLLGFAPPAAVRQVWRQRDERELRRAEAGLMSATTAAAVAEAIVPRVADMLGGHRAALVDTKGELLASRGFSAADVQGLNAAVAESIERERLVLPLRTGVLVIESSVYAPFFGDEELELVRSLGAFVDLALGRIALHDLEARTRKELERTNEELLALVYGISHDLRSPIVTVIGYLELLRTDSADQLDDEAKHYLERIAVSARYMDSLIRDLLELSRIGRTQTEVERVQLRDLAEDIAGELRRRHPAVTVLCSPGLPDVWMNPVRARQLLTNLMENAVRHGGREDVTVRIEADAGSAAGIVVTVRDNGVGIPDQHRERVFGIFERLDGEQEGKPSGTGIGLAMCRKIVDQVDGAIWIDDTDSGAAIKVALPRATVASPCEQERQQSPTDVGVDQT